mgnify:FL=1
MIFFENYFSEISKSIKSANFNDLEKASKIVNEASSNNKKIIIVGNGGSGAISSHVAVDFTKAAGIRAINFNEADLITCFANDYGYENWVSEALKSYADFGDVIVLISSSGESMNIINAANTARDMKNKILTFSGFSSSNPLRSLGDVNFWIDSRSYNYIEMTHHIWLVAICDYIISVKS